MWGLHKIAFQIYIPEGTENQIPRIVFYVNEYQRYIVAFPAGETPTCYLHED